MTNKNTSDFPWAEILPLAEKLLQLVSDSAPKKQFDVAPAVYFHIVGMFWRALRLYDGVLILLKAELPEEAAILARSLFEEGLRLQQLATDDQNRDALILGWANSSIDQLRGLFEVSKTCGLDDDISSIMDLLEKQRRQVRNSATQLNVKRYRKFLSIREAAFKFGRKDDYWTYEWSHESVHGSEGAWIFSRKTPAENTAGLHAKNNANKKRGQATFLAASLPSPAAASSIPIPASPQFSLASVPFRMAAVDSRKFATSPVHDRRAVDQSIATTQLVARREPGHSTVGVGYSTKVSRWHAQPTPRALDCGAHNGEP